MSRHPVSRRATRRPPRRRRPSHARRKEPPQRMLLLPPEDQLAVRTSLLKILQTQTGEAARQTRRQLRRYWTFKDSYRAIGTNYRLDVPDHVRRGEPDPNRKSKRPPKPSAGDPGS